MAQIGDELLTERSSPEFSQVPPAQVEAIWPAILPFIERGLRHGQGDGTTSDYLKWLVVTRKMQLWIVEADAEVQAGVIIAVRDEITGRKVSVEMLAGRNMSVWADELQALLLDFKDLVGAHCVEASCRRGLAKSLRELGWTDKAMIMELR